MSNAQPATARAVFGGEGATGAPPLDQTIYALINDLGEMQEATDRADLFAGLARAITSSLDADACVVSVVDEDGETLRDVAASVTAPSRLHRIVKELSLSDLPITREVVKTGRWAEISLSQPDDDSRQKRHLGEIGFRRVLMSRLLLDEETVGVVEIYRSADRPFNCEDAGQVALLATFASNAYTKIRISERMESHYTTTLEALAAALEAKDPYTGRHTSRIRDTSLALAVAMKVPSNQRRAVRLGAILHDVGKIGISDAILHKPASLSVDEWSVMRTHPVVGEGMLQGIDFLADALPVIRHHHERWDGAGYPDRLRGQDIPFGARIVAVCDAFDAMTSDRPYRKAMSAEAACRELLRGAGTQFDPTCARVLVDMLRDMGLDRLEEKLVRYAS